MSNALRVAEILDQNNCNFRLPHTQKHGKPYREVKKSEKKVFGTGLITLLLFLEISVDVFIALDQFKNPFSRFLYLPARFLMLSGEGKPKISIILIKNVGNPERIGHQNGSFNEKSSKISIDFS